MRMKLKVFFFVTIGYFIFLPMIYGQKTEINSVYEVLDTLKTHKNRITLSVKWMNDTIKITQSINPHEPDTFSIKSEKITISYGPNCFAHALDTYFKSNKSEQIDLFDKKSVIFDEDLKKILENSFSKVQVFHVKRKRLKNQKEINENSILVFKNQYEMVSHAIYFGNGLFYTKNGMYPVQQFSDINKIIKTYWDTKTIEVYQLSSEVNEKFQQIN